MVVGIENFQPYVGLMYQLVQVIINYIGADGL